ncbi:hypothetical protein L596_013105 [Steinernema carpocapsae]|uniref:Uncharacterized protein n=1 Tax=Steinernema carpocapsae TaxID=34508 RepID=A0A4U5NZ83_STECR|nr:hypothetical protein L596_013105 [Steinernema carpocapsae]
MRCPTIKHHYLWWSYHEHPECRKDYDRATKGDERHSEIPQRLIHKLKIHVTCAFVMVMLMTCSNRVYNVRPT